MKMLVFLLLSPFTLTLCAAKETTASLRFVTDTLSHDRSAGFHTSSTSPGIITTVAGDIGGSVMDGVAATSRKILSPQGVAFDNVGNLYIAARGDNKIYKVTASSGIITTVAGTGVGGYDSDGGEATSAMLRGPKGVALDTAGDIFIADTYNLRIRKITMSTGLITTVAGNGRRFNFKDNIAATRATLDSPSDVAVDPSGNIFIADTFNHRIRKVTASTGIITTIILTDYSILLPAGVTLDTAGNIYIAGGGLDPSIFKVTVSTGKTSIVAGAGYLGGYNGDDILATTAELNSPEKVVFDASGNMYILDTDNHRIRKVTASTGIITTVAGTGAKPSASQLKNGEGGLATAALLYTPSGIAVDSTGNLYFADSKLGVVRKVTFTGAMPSTSVTSAPSVKGAPSSSPSAAVASTPTASAPTPGASSSSPRTPTAPSSTATQSSLTTHFAKTLHLTIILLSSLLILHLCRDA